MAGDVTKFPSSSFLTLFYADVSGFCPLYPFHNYVSFLIMHSQSTLRASPATTFAHCPSRNPPQKSQGLNG